MGAERYVLLGTLGEDPTGATFLALESELDQRVVFKRFSPALAGDLAFIDGFRQDARIMALLDHPNCVCVLDFFVDEEQAVVVTEYIRGASLRAAVAHGGRMSAAEALGTIKGVLRGLAYAHDLGLVHRDIRPENVLVDAAGVAKLTAFGQTPKRLGQSGHRDVPGDAAAYMSPERLAGGVVGASSDIYSCGALLYQLLTGKAPYTGSDVRAIIRQHDNHPVPDPGVRVRSLPDEVSDLVTRAMARAPEDRPESADLFLHELEAAAIAAYGPEWERQSSIRRMVEAAAAHFSGSIALDHDVQTRESLQAAQPATISPARRYAAIGAAIAVLLTSIGGVAYAKGLIGGGKTATIVTPSAAASPSPTVDASPSPVPIPSPVVPPPVVVPPPATTTVVTLSLPVVWFAACTDAAATQCGFPVDGSGYQATKPFDAAAFPSIRLMDTFAWSYGDSGSEPQQVTVHWAVAASSGSGGSYPQIIMTRALARPSGNQAPDAADQEVVGSADPPSASSASFTITYTDSAGDHSVQAPGFYWTH